MAKNCKLIVTNSYFQIFQILKDAVKEKQKGLTEKNLIFCEDKVSLMAERTICANGGGSFNTDVYSFGKFLHKKKSFGTTLTKEGSAMAIKRILSNVSLQRFSKSRTMLAPALYDLIMQLKSASVTPQDVLAAQSQADGLLKNKLEDIYNVYTAYESYLKEKEYSDQSTNLACLSDVILNDEEVACSNVFIVGYRSWTRQAKDAITALVKKAKTVTAILTGGENESLFLNETVGIFKSICKNEGVTLSESVVASDYSKEAQILTDNIFVPSSYYKEQMETENIYLNVSPSCFLELERVAQTIKKIVIEGKCRYNQITVAIPQNEEYKTAVKQAFSKLEIPYFLDERKAPKGHPLITLILAYLEAMRKNLDRDAFLLFMKNPLITEDKEFADGLENYLIKYNINHQNLTKPFVFGGDEERAKYYQHCQNYLPYFTKADIRGMLKGIKAEEKLKKYSSMLQGCGETVLSEVNDKMFETVAGLLGQMDMLLGDVEISLTELKQIFLSGINTLEISVIPQNNDAVFVGAYKEVALAKAKYLFATGLDSQVPLSTSDVALLSDGDLTALENLNLLIEPKIRIVNDRERESTALAISAFTDKLMLSYSGGKGVCPSEIINYVQKLFNVKPLNFKNEYLTEKQGVLTFAKAVGEFAEGSLADFSMPSAFYKASSEQTKNKIDKLLSDANKEVKIRLEGEDRSVIESNVSPTTIETYYACPYKAFLSKAVNLQERETGESKANNFGLFIHDVLEKYVDRIKEVTDKESSDKLVDELSQELKNSAEYAHVLTDVREANNIERLIVETKKYAYRLFTHLQKSQFAPIILEKWLPKERAVKLCDGKVRLSGRVDRVDGYGDYIRVIDYKTSAEVSDNVGDLFTGRKLQLYLYASAFPDKKLAGAYYFKLDNEYKKDGDKEKDMVYGSTLNDEAVMLAQNSDGKAGDFFPLSRGEIKGKLSENQIEAYKKYAVAVTNKAAEQMMDGVIVASPYENACEYCQYSGICVFHRQEERKTLKVTTDTIEKAIENTQKEAENE